MSPKLILEQAVRQKLKVIAITDHNAVQHSILACQLSKDKNMAVQVIPGVELTSREEVHLLAYFPDISSLLKIEKEISYYLPPEKNNSPVFGYQIIYSPEGEIVEIDEVLRQVGLDIGLDNLINIIHQLGGIAIPAHIDKDRFSLLSQLGFLDREANFDAIEVSKFKWCKDNFKLGDNWEGFPVISGSDSHNLEDIGFFYMEDIQEEIRDFFTLNNFLKHTKKKM